MSNIAADRRCPGLDPRYIPGKGTGLKRLFVSGAVALAAAVGCSSTPATSEATARTSSAIQGGTTDSTHDFAVVVALDLGNDQGALCSGVLLAPNLVATARHCTAPPSTSDVECATTTYGTAYPVSDYLVSNATVLSSAGPNYGVSKVVVPTNADLLCGNDIALLILSQNVELPQYVEPVLSPPMTDHSVWASTVTAIGYGIDTPTDTQGTTAGTRRILQNIPLVCIPNDATFVDCYTDPQARSVLASDEFESGDGTCQGDSGSGAFDQTQFDAGRWVAFGVLSRGSVSSDQKTCVGSIYTRFDTWAQLLVDTANEAAQAGGYPPPAWVTAWEADGGGISVDGSAPALTDGTTCTTNEQCQSQNCVSSNGTNYICASACSAATSCPSGSTCEEGYCFPAATPGNKGGCSVAMAGRDPAQPVPWRLAVAGLAVVGLGGARRRRR